MTFSVVTTQKNFTERSDTYKMLPGFSGDENRIKKDDREGITRMLVYNFIVHQGDVGFNKMKGQETKNQEVFLKTSASLPYFQEKLLTHYEMNTFWTGRAVL